MSYRDEAGFEDAELVHGVTERDESALAEIYRRGYRCSGLRSTVWFVGLAVGRGHGRVEPFDLGLEVGLGGGSGLTGV